MRTLSQVSEAVREFFSTVKERDELQCTVMVTEEGISIREPHDGVEEIVSRVTWMEVESATIYSTSVRLGHLLCLELRTASGPAHIIHDQCEGWHELLGELPRRLPGCRKPRKSGGSLRYPKGEIYRRERSGQ